MLDIAEIGAADLDVIEPLWGSLFGHHAGLDGMPPVTSPEQSWATRRATYEGWFAEDETVFAMFCARLDGVAVGYGTVRVLREGTAATWDVGKLNAELETLAVLPEARGSGVGRALVERCRGFARVSGARHLIVGVAHSNSSALAFYEDAGFRPFYVDLLLET